jgi:hypothetical protein
MDSTSPSKDTAGQTKFKDYPTICCLQETHLIGRNKHCLRVKTWKICQANDPWKQATVTTRITDKVYFKLKLVKRDKDGHFIIIKGTIHQKEKTILSLYIPIAGAPNFIKQMLLDLKIDSFCKSTIYILLSSPQNFLPNRPPKTQS